MEVKGNLLAKRLGRARKSYGKLPTYAIFLRIPSPQFFSSAVAQ